MMNKSLSSEIWIRLLRGNPLEGLPIETKNGRLNLGGLVAPEPEGQSHYSSNVANVYAQDISGLKIKGRRLENLDFTGSRLRHVLFFDCSISNCYFDKSDC